MTASPFRGPDLDELARILPVPADRDLPAGRQQVLREHLLSEFRDTVAGQAPGGALSAGRDPHAWRTSARRPLLKGVAARRLRGKRLVIVAATSCVLVLATAVGLMLGIAKPRAGSAADAGGLGISPNFSRPLPGSIRTTVPGAQASVGFRIPLPHDAAASLGDLVGVWVVPGQVVDLIFDGGRVTIIMQRWTYGDPARWFRTELAEIKTGGVTLGTVNGQPAFVATARTDAGKSNPALVEFDWHGIDINVVSASYQPSVLVRIADSVR